MESTAPEQHWAIDIKWLRENRRSLPAMAKGCLCAKCRKKLKADQTELKPDVLLKAIKTCCSQAPEYITAGTPLQESAFRIFLANGNQPLTLDELGMQLHSRRGIDAYRTSVPVLVRLLKSDQHYGLRPVP